MNFRPFFLWLRVATPVACVILYAAAMVWITANPHEIFRIMEIVVNLMSFVPLIVCLILLATMTFRIQSGAANAAVLTTPNVDPRPDQQQKSDRERAVDDYVAGDLTDQEFEDRLERALAAEEDFDLDFDVDDQDDADDRDPESPESEWWWAE